MVGYWLREQMTANWDTTTRTRIAEVDEILHLLTNLAGGHVVGSYGCVAGAPLALQNPKVDVLLHRSKGPGLQP